MNPNSQVVYEMYDMLHSYEMKVPMQDQVKLDDLHEAVDNLKTSLDDAGAFIDERKAGMVAVLEKNIVELNEAALQVRWRWTLHPAALPLDPSR